IMLLGLLLEKDDAAFEGAVKALLETRDTQFAGLLCTAMWQAGTSRMSAHRSSLLKVLLAPELPLDLRRAMAEQLQSVFYGPGKLSDAERVQVLRAAQAVTASGQDAGTIRMIFAWMAIQELSAPSEAWTEFQRYLASEPNESTRASTLNNYFQKA